jgi:hypothetical protein
VLEGVPEDDRGPDSAHLPDLAVAQVRSRCVWLKTNSLAATAHKGLNKGPITGSHVENRTWRQYPVKTSGKRRACPAKYYVPKASEPAGHGAIPVTVCLVQLLRAWPRRRRRHAAPGAHDPAGTAVVGIIEPVIAPRALTGRGCRGERPCREAFHPLITTLPRLRREPIADDCTFGLSPWTAWGHGLPGIY